MSISNADGKDYQIAKNEDGTSLTILDLFNELKDKGEKAAAKYTRLAERNELHVSGDQFRDLDRRSGTIEDVPWNSDIPQVSHNLIRNLVLTWCQRLLQDRPSVTAFPNSAEPGDIQAAETASSLIEFIESENRVDQKMFDILKSACAHGLGGIKAYYDPDNDEIRWDLVTIFDFYIDPTENPDDAGWVIFRRYINEHEARALLKEGKVRTTDVAEEEYTIGDSETRKGIPVYEIWYRPDVRLKKGLYALIVGGNVVSKMDYPYVFKSIENPESDKTVSFLPLSLFKVGYIRGTVYGDTWMNDAVPIQRQINEIESVLVKLRRDTGAVKLLAPSNVIETWEDDNHMIKVDDVQKSQTIRWLEPPKINEILFRDRDRLERRLYDIAGLNEILTGAESAKSGTSAKQIAYLSQLDSMKNAGTARHIEKFLLNLWNITLHLVRQFYSMPRLIRIVGEDRSMTVVPFVGADIDGVGVRLEPRTGMSRYHAQKAKDIVERAQAGLEDPATVAERSETGLEYTEGQAREIELINQMIQSAAAGTLIQPAQVNPQLASSVIGRSIDTQQDPNLKSMLWQLKQYYDQQLVAAQQQQPQGVPQ